MFPSKFLQFPSILTHFHAANEKIQNGGRDLAISRGLVWVNQGINHGLCVSFLHCEISRSQAMLQTISIHNCQSSSYHKLLKVSVESNHIPFCHTIVKAIITADPHHPPKQRVRFSGTQPVHDIKLRLCTKMVSFAWQWRRSIMWCV